MDLLQGFLLYFPSFSLYSLPRVVLLPPLLRGSTHKLTCLVSTLPLRSELYFYQPARVNRSFAQILKPACLKRHRHLTWSPGSWFLTSQARIRINTYWPVILESGPRHEGHPQLLWVPRWSGVCHPLFSLQFCHCFAQDFGVSHPLLW